MSKIKNPTRSPRARMHARAFIFSLLLALGCATLSAQRPQFREWNFGAAAGLSPINAYAGLPTLSAHHNNISLELSPIPVAAGIRATYHFPVWTLFKKLNFNLDASVYAAHQNGKYRLTFPIKNHLHDENQIGMLAGPSIYFLKRCNIQALAGVGLISQYGDTEFRYTNTNGSYFREQAAISLEVRLFNTFAQ